MHPEYKKVKILMPHCPECKEQLKGNNSIANPWHCSCGYWDAIIYPLFKGEYKIIKHL